MKFLIVSVLLLVGNFGYAISKDSPDKFWCRAEPVPANGNYYIRTAESLETAKNLVRQRCAEEVQGKCQVTECGQGVHPAKFTCVASKWNEDKVGGFFAFGKTVDEAWKTAYWRCWGWENRIDRKVLCNVLCFPSDIQDK